jgi:hypothetical protein
MKNNEVIVKNNLRLLLEIMCFQSFGFHNNMSVESAIEKL